MKIICDDIIMEGDNNQRLQKTYFNETTNKEMQCLKKGYIY